jgi:hypothetical protein
LAGEFLDAYGGLLAIEATMEPFASKSGSTGSSGSQILDERASRVDIGLNDAACQSTLR